MFELLGLALVVKEIVDDRQEAGRLFVARREPSRPRRRYPGKTLPRSGALSPLESLRSQAHQQEALRAAIRNVEAAVVNAFIDMRRSLDAQHDQGVDELRREMVTGR